MHTIREIVDDIGDEEFFRRLRALREDEEKLKKRLQPLKAEWRTYGDQMLEILERADGERRGLTPAERARYDALEGPADLLERKIKHEETRFWKLRRTPTPESRPAISPSDLRRASLDGHAARRNKGIAIHEAAHAVVMVLEGIRISRVFLAADGGGAVTPGAASKLPACVYLAGAEGVAIARLEDAMPAWANGNDERNAMEQLGPYLVRHRKNVRAILRGSWAAVTALARALLGRGELGGAEAETIVRDNLSDETRRRLARRAA